MTATYDQLPPNIILLVSPSQECGIKARLIRVQMLGEDSREGKEDYELNLRAATTKKGCKE